MQDYLEERLREGESLTAPSPVITPKMKMKPFIKANNVSDAIKVSIKAAGFSWRPYVLRCYFDTMLMLAESKGLVLRDYRQFWMGHKGDIENRYTTNKQKLPESVIEDMRSAYARSEELLQTKINEETSEEKVSKILKKQLLLMAGFKQDEIDKMDLKMMTDEEVQESVRNRLLGLKAENGSKQMVVNVNEANDYLSKGWEYVDKLPNGKVVIKLSQT